MSDAVTVLVNVFFCTQLITVPLIHSSAKCTPFILSSSKKKALLLCTHSIQHSRPKQSPQLFLLPNSSPVHVSSYGEDQSKLQRMLPQSCPTPASLSSSLELLFSNEASTLTSTVILPTVGNVAKSITNTNVALDYLVLVVT